MCTTTVHRYAIGLTVCNDFTRESNCLYCFVYLHLYILDIVLKYKINGCEWWHFTELIDDKKKNNQNSER